MGIDVPSMALLSAAKCIGVDFTSTATIGRQNFAGDHVEAGLRRLFQTLDVSQDARDFRTRNHFCEELFLLLGAKQVESFDVSDYEQATHIHDMNQPIPANFHQRYSCVHDGGTIEHVFNIPQALKNCLQMVRLGGHFTQVNEANNYMGHGFWQLSPEMIYRTMSEQNGFSVQVVLLHETIPRGSWYIAVDPAKVGGGVQLCNSHPTYILTIAKRTAIREIFAKPPQQSDYAVVWSRNPASASQRQARKRPVIRRMLSRIKRLAIRALRLPIPPVYDPRHYRRITEEQVWRGEVCG